MTQLITTELVELDQNLGSSPEDVIRHLAGRVAANGRATSDTMLTSCNGQPSRAAASAQDEGAGMIAISALGT